MVEAMSWKETSRQFEREDDRQPEEDSSNYQYEIFSIETLDGGNVHLAPSGACAGCWHKLANDNIEGESDELKKLDDEDDEAAGGKNVTSKHLHQVENNNNKWERIARRSDEDNNNNNNSNTTLDTCPIKLMECGDDRPEVTAAGDSDCNNFEHYADKAEDVQLLVNITLRKKKIVEATSTVGDLQPTDVVDDNTTQAKCRDHHRPIAAKMLALITTNGSGGFSPRSQQSNKVFGFGQFRFTRHLAFIFILILSVIALVFLQHGSLRSRRTPSPTPFFEQGNNAFIVDFEFGQLKELWARLAQNEVSFVMYYAPWDSECIRARKEIAVVANHYAGEQIFFAAINCWWPDGECRKYHTIQRYPHFVASIRFGGEIQYHGPILASYIIPFLDNVLNPVVPILNEGEFLDLRSKHDAVLLAYFEYNEITISSPMYRLYLTVAIKALLTDPWRTVAYTLITNTRVAQKLKLEANKDIASLILYVGNETEYFSLAKASPQSILSWVYSRAAKARTLKWLNPSGVKSKALADYIQDSPTLILFTPRSFILGISPYFDLLQEIVLDYYNCDKSPIIRSLIHRNILRRRLQEDKLSELEERCHELLDEEETSREMEKMMGKRYQQQQENSNEDTCCHSQMVSWRSFGSARRGMTKRCRCTACVHISLPKCPAKCARFDCLGTAARFLDDFDPNSVNTSATYCNQIKTVYEPKYTPYYKVSATCSGTITPLVGTSGGGGGGGGGEEQNTWMDMNRYGTANDDRIGRMIQDFEVQHCRRLKLGMNYTDLHFPDNTDHHKPGISWRANFTGLACRTNRTLNFLALDSVLYPAFAEALGIDMFNMPHSSVVAIVDPKQESTHLLKHDIMFEEVQLSPALDSLGEESIVHVPINSYSKRTFMEFIKNFTEGTLPRFQRSQFVSFSSGLCDLGQLVVESEQQQQQTTNANIICVPELTSATFTNFVLGRPSADRKAMARSQPNLSKDLLVMYYAPWCGFCSSIAHIYLDVARFFAYTSQIIFTRINGDANDLAWEYSVDRYPTIMFFPARNRMNSVAFPANQAVTKSGLLAFILAHAQPSVRMEAMLLFCEHDCLFNSVLSNGNQRRSLARSLRHNRQAIMSTKYELQKVVEDMRTTKAGGDSMARLKTKRQQLEVYQSQLQAILRKLRRTAERHYLLSHFLLKRGQTIVGQRAGQEDIMLQAEMKDELYGLLFKSKKKPGGGSRKKGKVVITGNKTARRTATTTGDKKKPAAKKMSSKDEL